MPNDIDIQDDSNDRKYFTIIPNYILNHSTAVDQALYLQMKRIAGENGTCYVSQDSLCLKLGIGRKTLKRSLDYLVSHNWIEYLGRTGGKTRPINTYRIIDLWQENSKYYEDKKIPAERTVSPSEEKDTGQKNSKIPVESAYKEDIYKEEHISSSLILPLKKYSSLSDITDDDIREVANHYRVPEAFVKSKHEDMILWAESRPGNGKLRGRNWRLTLMQWVKKDALKIMERRLPDEHKRGIDASGV